LKIGKYINSSGLTLSMQSAPILIYTISITIYCVTPVTYIKNIFI
jgi:hypothetical protein